MPAPNRPVSARTGDRSDPAVLYVAGDSDPGTVAGKAAHTIRDREAAGREPRIFMQAIGAGAVNQMVKAIIITEAKLAETGHVAVSKPMFKDEVIDGEPRTAIRYQITARGPQHEEGSRRG